VAVSTASDEPRSAGYLPVALATGQRSESAHLATVRLPIEDDASIDDAVASSRAAFLAQFRAVELSSSRSLGADHQLSCSTVES